MSYTYHLATDAQLEAIYELSGSEWRGPFTIKEYAKSNAKKHRHFDGEYTTAYYAEFEGKIVSTVCILDTPALIGERSTTGHALLLAYVFTDSEHRRTGLALKLINHVINKTETAIRKQFPGATDLHEKFIFVLYSAVGEWYKRFGFVLAPISFYTYPSNLKFDNDVYWLTAKLELDQEIIGEVYEAKKQLITSEAKKKSFSFVPCIGSRHPHTEVEQHMDKLRPAEFAKYFKYQGGVVKSKGKYYVCLWNTLMLHTFFIRDFTELSEKAVKILEANNVIIPEVENAFESLLRAGAFINLQRHPTIGSVFVAKSDLPTAAEDVLKRIDPRVNFVEDFTTSPNVLPMVRPFSDGEGVEWLQNGMWSWG